MPKPSLLGALRRAADHRTDVRKFTVAEDGTWDAITYTPDDLSGKLPANLNPDHTMEDLLDTMLGDEPQFRGRRDDRWHLSRNKALSVRVRDCDQGD